MTTHILMAALTACTACSTQAADPAAGPADVCTVIGTAVSMPDQVRETSGGATSSRDPGIIWTHNDRNNSTHIHAVDEQGRLRASVRVTGARNVDWEDMERAPCEAGSCLYIGDIGDNEAARGSITIYEVQEPRLDDEVTADAHAYTTRYADGARDAEALIVTPDGDIYIITKGREGPVTLFRLPLAARGTDAPLEKVLEIAPRPSNRADWVTGATLSGDGRWVVMRTYRTLFFFSAAPFLAGEAVQPIRHDLTPLRERQGEGVAMSADGTVWLTSEAESRRLMPGMVRLSCTLPAAG